MGNLLASVLGGSIILLSDFFAREIFLFKLFIDAPVYIRLSIYVFILFVLNLIVFSFSRGKKVKDKLRPIHRVIRLNLDKWEGITNGSIVPRKKSEKGNTYIEINKALDQYYEIIMKEKRLKRDHLAAYNAIKKFTKFPEAVIQPDLFRSAKEALSNAFKKEEKAHNKSLNQTAKRDAAG